jgi:hypothetical protein
LKIDKSIDNLAGRLDKLESGDAKAALAKLAEIEYRCGLTEDEYEKLTPMEKYELKFNWYLKEIMPYYKAEVMSIHNLTSEEYDRRVLEGDHSIYLPQPKRRFSPTSYKERVAHVLGLDYHGLQDKIARGEIKDKIATGGVYGWRDEDPQAVF